MPDEVERLAREAYETYRVHCLEESPYWEPLWHPTWDELSQASRDSWVAGVMRQRQPPKETKKAPFFKRYNLLKKEAKQVAHGINCHCQTCKPYHRPVESPAKKEGR